MARPRIIQLDQGKVSLQDFPPETSTALVEHIKAFFEPQIIIPAGQPIESIGSSIFVSKEQALKDNIEDIKNMTRPGNTSVNLDTLQDIALSVKMDKKNLKVSLVEVKYNVETKEAIVTHTEDFDNAKEASVKFKVKAAQLNFV